MAGDGVTEGTDNPSEEMSEAVIVSRDVPPPRRLRRSTCRGASSPAPASSPRGRRLRAALPAKRRRALALPRGRGLWEPRPEAMRRLAPLRRPKLAGGEPRATWARGEARTTWMISWLISGAPPAVCGPREQQRRLRCRVHRRTLAH